MPQSKRSGPPSRPNDRKSSGSNWKAPEPADVISYSYLWFREAQAGEESGRKDRPVVVVVGTLVQDGRLRLLVAPISHSPPERPDEAVEIPSKVRQHLGLDSERTWIVVTELNSFLWPGPDIRLAPGSDNPLYDAIPDWLFERVRAGLLRQSGSGRLRTTKRSE